MLAHPTGPRVRDYAILVAVCLVCAAVNVTKAVHVDDTVHLAIADAILRDPVHVMAAPLNWRNTAEPIGATNHPHLFFYLQALVTLVFGRSELAQHLLIAAVTAVTVWVFYRLAAVIAPGRALVLTVLFALGPAFLPGQNVMIDVPLVGLWLLFFWALVSRRPSGAVRDGVAAFAVAAACLVKYSSLVLIVVFAAAVVRRRRWSSLAWVAVPIGALVGWSVLNVIGYGSIHLLNRRAGALLLGPVSYRALDWVIGIGAVAPFTIAWWPRLSAARTGRRALVAAGALALALFAALGVRGTPGQAAAWWAVFFGNGLLTLALAAGGARRASVNRDADRDDQRAILLLWLAGAGLFIVLFSPFMGVRHVLLAVPAILLLLGSNRALPFEGAHAAVAVAVTAAVGLGLAVSDYVSADVYRRAAPQIRMELPADARVWCVGHWGWQWYAARAGMQVYDTRLTALQPGDFVVVPAIPDSQDMPRRHARSLTLARRISVPAAGPVSALRTMSVHPRGGYYGFSLHDGTGPPWLVSTAPLETFSIYRVTTQP